MNHLSHSVIPIMPPYPTHIPIQLSNCSTAKTGETSRISQQLTMSPSDPAQARMIRLVLRCGEEAVAITSVNSSTPDTAFHRVYKGLNAVPQAVSVSTCQRMTC